MLKRESMFVQLLEGLSAEEAELLVLAKDGRMNDKYKRITKAVVSPKHSHLLNGEVVPDMGKGVKMIKQDCDPSLAEDRSLPYTAYLGRISARWYV